MGCGKHAESGGGSGGEGGEGGGISASSGTGTSSGGQGGASSGQGGSGQGAGPSSTSSSTSSSASTGSGGGSDADAQLCVDLINQHRASIGLPPYKRWTSAEACSDGEATSDSQTGTPHGAFGKCGEFAQNECPGWPGAPGDIIGPCLQMMWDEGPGADFSKHGHYINMSSTQYTEVACGFHVTPDGSVWAVQNFH